MKVIHICTCDYGGAGLCCLRINDALKKIGIDSKVLVLNKKSKRDDVFKYGYYKWFVWKIINKFFRFMRINFTEYNRVLNLGKQLKTAWSFPISIVDVSSHYLVKQADVVHLHWIGNFVDIPSFFQKVNKPIVWTLHDEFLFCGIRQYADSQLEIPLDKKYYEIKYNSIKKISNFGVVFLSNLMFAKFHNEKIIKDRKMTIINNSVDYSMFKPVNKKESRRMLGIDNNCIVFVFVAASINDQRKGFDLLCETLDRMNIPNAVIVAVGNNNEEVTRKNVISLGPIYSTQQLSVVYSCADYFVMPSQKEAFAQTPLEAMACGLPAIVFPVSGTEELVNINNGVVCDDYTSESLERGIETAMHRNYSSEYIRQNIIDRFSPEVMAEKYVKFYNQILI